MATPRARLRRDGRRRRPQRAGRARRTWPRPGCGRSLVEARSIVGGTASSESFAGATVNICNCDHITFRTTPVIEELGLADHGLRYIDIDPAQHNMAWTGGPAWRIHHDVEQTLDSLAAHLSRRGRRLPAVRARRRCRRSDWCSTTPTIRRRSPTIAKKALRRATGAASPTLLRWSRRSAADVMRSFFTSDALLGPAMVTGPMVWGVVPRDAGHRARRADLRDAPRRPRRPPGRRQRVVPEALPPPSSRRRARCDCDADGRRSAATATRVRGVTLDRRHRGHGAGRRVGVRPAATRSWSGCTNPPPQAAATGRSLARRSPHADGYESKVDAVVDRAARAARRSANRWSNDGDLAPSLAEIDRGRGDDGERRDPRAPGDARQRAVVADPTMAPAGPARVQPRGAVHAVRPARRLGGTAGAAALARAVRRRCASRGSSTRSSTGGR